MGLTLGIDLPADAVASAWIYQRHGGAAREIRVRGTLQRDVRMGRGHVTVISCSLVAKRKPSEACGIHPSINAKGSSIHATEDPRHAVHQHTSLAKGLLRTQPRPNNKGMLIPDYPI